MGKKQKLNVQINYDELVDRVKDYGVLISCGKLDEIFYELHNEWYSVAYTSQMDKIIVVLEISKSHDPFSQESFL